MTDCTFRHTPLTMVYSLECGKKRYRLDRRCTINAQAYRRPVCTIYSPRGGLFVHRPRPQRPAHSVVDLEGTKISHEPKSIMTALWKPLQVATSNAVVIKAHRCFPYPCCGMVSTQPHSSTALYFFCTFQSLHHLVCSDSRSIHTSLSKTGVFEQGSHPEVLRVGV